MRKIAFISHSSSDSELAFELIRFLQVALDFTREQIVCASKPGEIPSGATFVDVIRDGLVEADCLLLLVTPDYLESKFCLAEMGAAWAIQKPVIPLLVPPMQSRGLDRTPLANTQCRSLGDKDDVRLVAEELCAIVDRSPKGPQLEYEIDRFFKYLGDYVRDSAKAHEAALDRSVDRLMATLALKNWRALEQQASSVLDSIEALKDERYRVLSDRVKSGELDDDSQIWAELEQLRDHYGELDDPDDLLTRHNPEAIKLQTLALEAKNPVVRNALVRIGNPRTSPVDRKVCGEQLAQFGDPRVGVGISDSQLPDIDWVEVPEGTFLHGLDKDEEKMQRFFISRYPVTNIQFRTFVEAGGYSRQEFYLGADAFPEGKFEWAGPAAPNCPVVNVTWHEANAFCLWLGEILGVYIRLPTALEWEKAARGPHGREYPYGNRFDAGKGNTRESNLQSVVAVGLFPHGISPYGVHDLGGLVWNWTDSFYQYNEEEGKILKGGSFRYQADYARAFSAGKKPQVYRSDHGGFRVACDDPRILGGQHDDPPASVQS